MDRFVKLALIIAGSYFVLKGKTYGFWVNDGPGGGFLPMIIGIVLIILGIYSVIREKPEHFKSKEFITALKPFSAILVTLILINFIGFFPAVILFVLSWLICVEKYKPLKAITIDAVVAVVMYGIFSMWLKVPFPTGIFF